MKYGFLGPAGSNLNYIGQVISGSDIKPILAYHDNDNGSHSLQKNMNFKQWPLWNSDCENHVNNPDYTVVQILCKKQQKFLLLNWFEKHSRRKESAYPFMDDWKKTQLEAWKSADLDETNTLARAVLHWFYKISHKDNDEIKDIPMIKNKFIFDAFYDSNPHHVQEQFSLYQIDYSTKMFDEWRDSQKIIFDSYENIMKKIAKPLDLEVFWHRGIAIGIDGLGQNLNEVEAWQKWYGKN